MTQMARVALAVLVFILTTLYQIYLSGTFTNYLNTNGIGYVLSALACSGGVFLLMGRLSDRGKG